MMIIFAFLITEFYGLTPAGQRMELQPKCISYEGEIIVHYMKFNHHPFNSLVCVFGFFQQKSLTAGPFSLYK